MPDPDQLMSNPQARMFNGSYDFSIEGGIFNNIAGNLNVMKFQESGERGLFLLYQSACASAVFNAEARFPPPLCHSGTRESILGDLKTWIDSPGDLSDIRWLYGPAGAGKSAIAQTLAETCSKDDTLAGSFFFWRSDSSRNNPRQLFTTIAFQLAILIPELRPIINSVVLDNPYILTSSIEAQFNALIVGPCLKAQLGLDDELAPAKMRGAKWNLLKMRGKKRSRSGDEQKQSKRSIRRILIIDGLDECLDTHDQLRVLSILSNGMQKHGLPFRLLIASRPEPRIREAFRGPHFERNCLWTCLDDNFQASCDIRRFLQDEFCLILERHSETMEHVPRPWPTTAQIEHLVEKASGHFIYPSTVLKFINDDGAVPADRLDVILGLAMPEKSDSPFAALDALYRQILSKATNKTLLLRILGVLVLYRAVSHEPGNSEVFLALLQIPLGTVRATLSGAHSLFREPSPVESGFEFCHASFTDFLLDPDRSLEFFVDQPRYHDYLAQSCLDVLLQDTHTATNIVPQARWYALDFWGRHCAASAAGNPDMTLSPELTSKLSTFDVYAAATEVVWTLGRRRGGSVQAVGLSSPKTTYVVCELLVDFLEGAYRVWFQLQNKPGLRLQQFHDISTKGFTIKASTCACFSRDQSPHDGQTHEAVLCPDQTKHKEPQISVALSPDLDASIVSGVDDPADLNVKFDRPVSLIRTAVRHIASQHRSGLVFMQICPLSDTEGA
ncbi:hypothetical protein D9757_000012 [Collybiopsis confluens]|uniref:Nephrocystin 3-like N-terminal domain-containing protein n=1 Tax=Collybiopsis confluens TaxID=2823264 RepID=A0A8H5I282_9AGAR|nr:hypothetical protein D9757_000012 [Collybiopsis confluens]